jgi:formate dehydrogenase iron-sulfur subunit
MYSILVDVTKCTGCEKCVDACIDVNKLNKTKADYDRATAKDGLSDNRFLSIVEVEQGHFARKSCMHCLEPSCVSACLVGGLTKTENGAIVYDPDKCIGCRYCMLSCPFSIPRYQWDKPSPYIKKCQMCYDKLEDGGKPACVEACPSNAIVFGDRKQLLAKAKSIIRKDPSKYIDHVWGEKEFGGTSLLYISDVDLAEIGWPEKSTTSIPELTEPLIEKTPFIGLGVGLGLVSLNWIVGRRKALARKNNVNDVARNEAEGGKENAK